jgi:hypothetical protein
VELVCVMDLDFGINLAVEHRLRERERERCFIGSFEFQFCGGNILNLFPLMCYFEST